MSMSMGMGSSMIDVPIMRQINRTRGQIQRQEAELGYLLNRRTFDLVPPEDLEERMSLVQGRMDDAAIQLQVINSLLARSPGNQSAVADRARIIQDLEGLAEVMQIYRRSIEAQSGGAPGSSTSGG